MDLKVSRPVSLLVSLTTAVVIGYMVWDQTVASGGTYPIASKDDLKIEFSALPPDSGASAGSELELVDRLTMATLNQKYVSTNARDEVAHHYDASFRANG
jgi:hypothetical protein